MVWCRRRRAGSINFGSISGIRHETRRAFSGSAVPRTKLAALGAYKLEDERADGGDRCVGKRGEAGGPHGTVFPHGCRSAR